MDALARRPRHGRVSTGKRVRPTPADILTFQVLRRHGPLPSTYIHAFTRELRRNEGKTKERLGDLYHEDNTPHGGPYLDRPWQQWQSIDARYQPAVAENTPLAEQVLRERGLLADTSTTRGGEQFAHRFMVACVTASIELATRDDPAIRFIPEAEILARSPHKTLEIPCSITYANPRTGKRQTVAKPLIPDALFGLEYAGAGYRFFMVEVDRNHEPVRRANLAETSYLRKILQYREVIEKDVYKWHFGMTAGMLVLNVTTNFAHMENIGALVDELTDGKGCPYLLFKTLPVFGQYPRVPPILRTLLTEPWWRGRFEPLAINRGRSHESPHIYLTRR
jgi:hypothetical protein